MEPSTLRQHLLTSETIPEIDWGTMCATLTKGSLDRAHLETIYLLIVEDYYLGQAGDNRPHNEIMNQIKSLTRKGSAKSDLPYDGKTIVSGLGATYRLSSLPSTARTLINRY